MGFSFRKSINLGLLKINLSKSGPGVSFGVKGFRVSKNSKGTNLNIGRKGLYYRKHFGNNQNEEYIEEFQDVGSSKDEKITECEKVIKLSKYRLCKHCGMKILKTSERCSFCGALNNLKIAASFKILIGLIFITTIAGMVTNRIEYYVLLAFFMICVLPMLLIYTVIKNFIDYRNIRKSNNLKLFAKVNYLTQGADYHEKNKENSNDE